jgi:predicted RNA-binding Zn ribbon-like protein
VPELWSWLGEPLAIDFANTVRRRGKTYIEHLRSGDDLATWSRHQHGRVPVIDAGAADARFDDVRALRDEVLALLRATAGRPGSTAAASGAPEAPATRINAALRETPLVPQLGPDGARLEPVSPAAPLDELLSRVAASAIELASPEAAASLALCDAPGCGQLYVRRRRDQRWCDASCGTRARVARHAAHQRG